MLPREKLKQCFTCKNNLECWGLTEDIQDVKLKKHFAFFCQKCETWRVLQQLKDGGKVDGVIIRCGNCGTRVKLKRD